MTARVTPQVAAEVMQRDGGCVAVLLGAADDCRDKWGTAVRSDAKAALTLDHVRDQPMMGKSAPSDARHLVTLCWGHHLHGWATSHRPEIREYLERVNG